MPPFTFNFMLKKPNMKYVPEQEHTVARTVKGTGNICPYPIPTVEEIIKMIEQSPYRVNKSNSFPTYSNAELWLFLIKWILHNTTNGNNGIWK